MRRAHLFYAAEIAANTYPLEALLRIHGLKPSRISPTHIVYSCPFHDEQTPSMKVNKTENLFYCFGCQAGGSPTDFLRELFWADAKYERITQRQAVLYIARGLLGCKMRDLQGRRRGREERLQTEARIQARVDRMKRHFHLA